jgi:fumarate hydratase subunit beta
MNYEINLPTKIDAITHLKIGDVINLSGLIITARDLAHKRIINYIHENKSLPDLFKKAKNTALYHCGPIIKKMNGKYKIISAGPTTSARMNSVENEVVNFLDIHIIIGKGGMENLDVKNQKLIYLNFPGGCGAIASKMIKEVLHVEWLDLGSSEAIWFLTVEQFGPLIVTQDISGNSLYK